MFNDENFEKVSNGKVQEYIYNQMIKTFPYVSEKYLDLKNSKNSTMFLLFLLISSDNPKAHKLIKKVEGYIFKK